MIAGFISLFVHSVRVRNPLGMMALAGFITEGISLDAQVYRTFAIAIVLVFLVKNEMNGKCDILFNQIGGRKDAV